jgi:microcystin-dependent protein
MAQFFILPRDKFFGANAVPLANGKLYFYVAGTTTPSVAYSDSALTTPATDANGMVAIGSDGLLPQLYLATGDYKIVLKSSVDATQYTFDNYAVSAQYGAGDGLVVDGANLDVSFRPNVQTGTTYTIQSSDRARNVIFSNINPVTVTLPVAGANYPDGWFCFIARSGSTNEAVAINAASQINGQSSITLGSTQSIMITSDGTTFYASFDNGAPVGTLQQFAGNTIPGGYLECTGAAISRSTYARLFSAIGTLWGVGDGSTTFNLPNGSGRTFVGVDANTNIIQATTTITTTSASATATVASATNLVIGMIVVSANVPAGTTISDISGTTITLSAAATASASGTAARFSIFTDANVVGSYGGKAFQIQLEKEIAAHAHTTYQGSDTVAGGGAIVYTDIFNTPSAYTSSTVAAGASIPMNILQPSFTGKWIIKF